MDWSIFINERCYTSGYCTFTCEDLVIWKSKKQSAVTRSGTQTKCKTMAHEVCDFIWLKIMLHDLALECPK